MLTVTASILETIIVRTSVFAGQQLLNVVYYGGSSLYNWYYPTLTETEILQKQVKMLQNELNDLKDIQYKNIEKSIIILDDDNDNEEDNHQEDNHQENNHQENNHQEDNNHDNDVDTTDDANLIDNS